MKSSGTGRAILKDCLVSESEVSDREGLDGRGSVTEGSAVKLCSFSAIFFVYWDGRIFLERLEFAIVGAACGISFSGSSVATVAISEGNSSTGTVSDL